MKLFSKDLHNLKKIYLFSNMIDILEDGLFKNNPILEEIDFSNNRIIVIHWNLFKGLSNINKINLNYNSCINRYYEKSQLSRLHEEVQECTYGNTWEAKYHKLNFQLIDEMKLNFDLQERAKQIINSCHLCETEKQVIDANCRQEIRRLSVEVDLEQRLTEPCFNHDNQLRSKRFKGARSVK